VFWFLAGMILPVWSVMVRYRFTPQSKLPKTGPFILAPNHYSEIDPNPMGAAGQLIERESGVIVYPEGSLTRDPDLWPMRGKSGAVRLALESGIPLIPVAHWGTQDLMPRYAKRIHPFPRKTIRVSVGEPLDLSRFENRPVDQRVVTEATSLLMDSITALLAELRGEQPPAERWDPSKHQQNETGRF
jgi:1-acyl-sn-glycerol-3-phosphate acyltransferase